MTTKTWIRVFAGLLSVVLMLTVACGCRSGEENSTGNESSFTDENSDVTDSTGEADNTDHSNPDATTGTTTGNTGESLGTSGVTGGTKPGGSGSAGTTKPSTGSGIADLVSNGSKDIPSQTYAYVKDPGVGIAMEKKTATNTFTPFVYGHLTHGRSSL